MIYVVLALIVVALVVWLNMADHRRRAAMTPVERAREDAETDREMRNW